MKVQIQIGQVYLLKHHNDLWILKASGWKGDRLLTDGSVALGSKSTYMGKDDVWGDLIGITELRVATQEEADWLESCRQGFTTPPASVYNPDISIETYQIY